LRKKSRSEGALATVADEAEEKERRDAPRRSMVRTRTCCPEAARSLSSERVVVAVASPPVVTSLLVWGAGVRCEFDLMACACDGVLRYLGL
jgi:hypothetical protein